MGGHRVWGWERTPAAEAREIIASSSDSSQSVRFAPISTRAGCVELLYQNTVISFHKCRNIEKNY